MTGARVIKHGQHLARRHVGPAAGGFATASRATNGILRPGRMPDATRSITTAATYAGHSLNRPHLLVEGVAFDEPLDIVSHVPLVLLGISVRVSGNRPWAIHTRPESAPILIIWSSVGGTRGSYIERGLYLRSAGSIVHRCLVSTVADGLQLHAARARITETLVEELIRRPGSHNDGIQMLGAANEAHIERSRIMNAHPQTSCLMIHGSGHAITDNYFAGGGWTIYAAPKVEEMRAGLHEPTRFIGNLIGRDYYPNGGHFGPVTGLETSVAAGDVWSGNRLSDGRMIGRGER